MFAKARYVVLVFFLIWGAMGDHHHTHGRADSSEVQDKHDQILQQTKALKDSVQKNQQILEANKDALSKAHDETSALLKSIGEQLNKKDKLPEIENAIRSLHETTHASHEVVSQHKTETASLQHQVKQIKDAVEKTQSSLAQLQQELSKLKEGFQKLNDNDQKRKQQDYSEILNQLLANQAVLLSKLNSTSTLDSLWQFTRSFLSGVKRGALQVWSQVSQVASEALISGKGLADFYGNQGFKGFTDIVPKLRRFAEDVVDLIKIQQRDLKGFISSHGGAAVAPHAETIAWAVLGVFGFFTAVIFLVLLGRICRCLCCCCCRRKNNAPSAEHSNAPAGERAATGKKGKKGTEAKPAAH